MLILLVACGSAIQLSMANPLLSGFCGGSMSVSAQAKVARFPLTVCTTGLVTDHSLYNNDLMIGAYDSTLNRQKY